MTNKLVERGLLSQKHQIECMKRGAAGWPAALLVGLSAVAWQGCNGTGERRTAPPIAHAQPPAPVVSRAASATPTPAPTSALQEGAPAPDVMLTLQDGFQLPISAEHGKLVAFYFCSPETSPDCIREANGLRDHGAELHLRHVVVIGVSPRDAASHRAFIAEHRLPFDLVSDADGRIASAYKVPTLGDYGPQTFLVGRDGKLRKAWLTTNPESRAQEILDVAAD